MPRAVEWLAFLDRMRGEEVDEWDISGTDLHSKLVCLDPGSHSWKLGLSRVRKQAGDDAFPECREVAEDRG